jgi:hypothetical protein
MFRAALALAIVGIAGIAVWAPAARAEPAKDAVALLPLDADKRMEIYGQPVASELARALGAGGLDVVVVGPKMAVPERAILVIDGTITAKGEAIALGIRIRERATGTVLDTLAASAPSLANIDAAAAELSARVLPSAKKQLAMIHERDAQKIRGSGDPGIRTGIPDHPAEPVDVKHPPAPAAEPVDVKVAGAEPFRGQLASAMTSWVALHPGMPRGNGVAFVCDVRGYSQLPGKVPMARARVHVAITAGGTKLFDRVVVTDTVVGDKASTAEQLAARVAREVTSILDPHMRRVIPAWR